MYFIAKMQEVSSLKTKSDYQNIITVWHVVVMMDIEINCEGHTFYTM